jgi:hypothetical protein
MKKHLNRGIKQVLKDYPQLASILADYDINCYKCDGNCIFKDIFEEHNLSMRQEMEIKSRIVDLIPA